METLEKLNNQEGFYHDDTTMAGLFTCPHVTNLLSYCRLLYFFLNSNFMS